MGTPRRNKHSRSHRRGSHFLRMVERVAAIGRTKMTAKV
jgi:hypothetical protein